MSQSCARPLWSIFRLSSLTCTSRSYAERSSKKATSNRYAELMQEHWEHKRIRSPGMASERIDRSLRSRGAVASWAAGSSAPGGGVLLLCAHRPDYYRQAMAAAKVPPSQLDFEFGGAYTSGYA